jgi:Protein kinase domain
LPVRDVLQIGREIALGLAAAHDRGLIHRDIKPANIFLEHRTAKNACDGRSEPSSTRVSYEGRFPRVKILDFGLARAAAEDTQVTKYGQVLGTPAFMAPEQADGGPIEARCDLFSLGCVLYHMATGSAPFRRSTLTATFMALATHHPPRPIDLNPDLPIALSDLIMELLAKKPADRLGSANEAAARLRDLEGGDPTDTDSDPTRRRRGWPRIVAAAISVVGASLILLGGTIYVVTDKGSIQISTEDTDVQVRVEQAGRLITILDPRSSQAWTINSGTYTVRLDGNPEGLEIALPDTFVMKRGDVHVVTIRKTLAPAVAGKVQSADAFQKAYLRVRDAGTLLGEPISEAQNGAAGARFQAYEHGQIIQPPGSPTAFAIHGPIFDAYYAIKDHGMVMGQPRAGIEHWPDGAASMRFENGLIQLPPESPLAYALYGPIFEAYRSVANPGVALGPPQSDIQGGFQGAKYVQFERGQIILPPKSNTAHAFYGLIHDAYCRVGNVGANFGHPRGGILDGYAGAKYVPFDRGQIILPPKSNTAHAIYGPFYAAYLRLKNHADVLGQPISDLYTDGNTRRIDFERGWIECAGGDDAEVHLNERVPGGKHR